MSEVDAKPPQESPLTNIIVNVLIPIMALTMLSKDPAILELDGKQVRPWHLGPVVALILALALPVSYGIWFFIKHRKLNFFSVVGLVSVLLTGGLTLYLWQKDGSVRPSAPVLFGIKEGSIPLILGLAIFLSHWTKTPLLNTFLYSPQIFDIKKIEKMVKERDTMPDYGKLLFTCTVFFAASFLISTVANYFLAQHFLGGIDFDNKAAAREQYNAGVGKLTGWGFVAIGLPILVILMFVMWHLVTGLKKLTGLDTDEILLPR
ncbi:MAG: VC0807 family protein [Roseibacillus sp.]|jgi:hypothetical protein